MAVIEFLEDTQEERVHPFNFEDPKSEKSGKRYDIKRAKGSRLECSYSSALYWVNRGVARVIEASDEERAEATRKRNSDYRAAAMTQAGVQRQASPMPPLPPAPPAPPAA